MCLFHNALGHHVLVSFWNLPTAYRDLLVQWFLPSWMVLVVKDSSPWGFCGLRSIPLLPCFG